MSLAEAVRSAETLQNASTLKSEEYRERVDAFRAFVARSSRNFNCRFSAYFLVVFALFL